MPCVIDIEASGFGRSSYPIEVGYVLPDSSAVCMLIKPVSDWRHWDESAAGTHRITRSLLLQHGRAPREVAQRINQDLAGFTVYCDGWAHDFVWLAVLFDEAGLSPSFRLESVNRLLSDSQLARLDEVRRNVMLETGLKRHRASNDARVLQTALHRVGVALRPELRPWPAHAPATDAT